MKIYFETLEYYESDYIGLKKGEELTRKRSDILTATYTWLEAI